MSNHDDATSIATTAGLELEAHQSQGVTVPEEVPPAPVDDDQGCSEPAVRPLPDWDLSVSKLLEGLEIEFSRIGKSAYRVTAKIDGRAVFVDRGDLESASYRERVARRISDETGMPEIAVCQELTRRVLHDGEEVDAVAEPTSEEVVAGALAELDREAERQLACESRQIAEVAEAMLHSPDLLEQLVADIQKCGVAGEDILLATIYLVCVSRLLETPLSAIIQGPSGTGKSEVLSTVVHMVPPEFRLGATDLTPHALFYMPPGRLSHRVVSLGELKKQDNDATQAMREMLSEGELRKVTAGGKGGKSKEIWQPGPIALVQTTTRADLFDEDASRLLLLSTDDSPEQTARVLQGMASAQSRRDIEAIVSKHHALQRMLRRVNVEVPFAQELVQAIPTHTPQARRAFGQVLATVKASALLHQCQRQRLNQHDPQVALQHGDTILAKREDYEVARRLLQQPLQRGLGGAPSDALVRFARWLESKFDMDKNFSCTEIIRLPDAPLTSKDKVNARLKALADIGVIKVSAKGVGSIPTYWRRATAIAELNRGEFLPAPEILLQANTVPGDNTGTQPPEGLA